MNSSGFTELNYVRFSVNKPVNNCNDLDKYLQENTYSSCKADFGCVGHNCSIAYFGLCLVCDVYLE